MIEIIIPTYKPQEYFYECLSSLNKQKLSFSKFRVVIILNGPKEPYYSLILKWLDIFDFNVLLMYTHISGVSHARNIALNNCGLDVDYVCFLDDDDILSENYLEKLSDLADGKSLIVSNTKNFYDKVPDSIDDYLTFQNHFSSKNIIKYRRYLSNACCKLIPFSLIENVRFSEKLKNSEDSVFMFELSKNIKNIISSDVGVIYYRRLRVDSSSRKKISIKDSLLLTLNIMLCFSMIYFKNPFKYNLILYLTRLMAALKRFWLNIK